MDPRYPTGRFSFNPTPTAADRASSIDTIGSLPAEIRRAAEALSDQQLDTPYREGGWTGRQVIHHVADSHMNAYIRFKLIVTEEAPTLKPYDETLWADLADGRTGDPAVSLGILDGVHQRLHRLLTTLEPAQFARTGHHPERGSITLDWLLQLYAWHGRHHIGHLTLIASGPGISGQESDIKS